MTKLLLLLFFCMIGGTAADEASVKKIVESRIPDMPVDSVHATPFYGLYEVRAGGQVFYTDEEVTYIFLGRVLDGRSMEDLTAARSAKINAIPFADLPLNQAITIVRGKGTRKFAYFADPLCGYCRRFDAELAKLDDATIYVFVLPMLSPKSTTLARAVWCSGDPAKAWQDLMVKGVEPKAKMPCTANEIERTIAFSRERRISGTPTLVFENSQRIDGMLPLQALNEVLNEARASKPASTKTP
jgi:thiol:disulfide interchange protein DsbC